MSAIASIRELPSVTSRSAEQDIGTMATRGAFWTISFSFLTKGSTILSQIALAWFLLPEDFGLAAMSISFVRLASIFSGTHLRTILIQKGFSSEQLAGQVFWFSFLMSSVAALILMCMVPLGQELFDEPRLGPLVVLAAVISPIQSLSIVYSAKMHCLFRFRHIATVNFSSALTQSIVAVALAGFGLGPYALILGLVAGAVVLTTLSRLWAGRVKLGWPQPAHWRELLGPAGWFILNALAVSLVMYGVHLTVSIILKNPTTTGFYYWGYSVASQMIFLLVTNLQVVFLPVFSKLNDDMERQRRAVCRACQWLFVLVVPACLTQMIVAKPMVHWLFKDKWMPAVPVVEWLSLGLIFQPLVLMATSVLLAKGRYAKLVEMNLGMAIALLGGAWIGCLWGTEREIAILTSMALCFSGLRAGWILFRTLGLGWKSLLQTMQAPLLAAMWAVAGAVSVAWMLSELHEWARLMACAVGLAIYAFVIHWQLPSFFTDLLQRFHRSSGVFSRPKRRAA